jgi:hypothetical protein
MNAAMDRVLAIDPWLFLVAPALAVTSLENAVIGGRAA